MFDITKFNKIVFFTGAGMSAESGVPTYRGKGGIWDTYDWQSVASQRAFIRDPESVLQFHNYRRSLVYDCLPNAGHGAIVNLEHENPCMLLRKILMDYIKKPAHKMLSNYMGVYGDYAAPPAGLRLMI